MCSLLEHAKSCACRDLGMPSTKCTESQACRELNRSRAGHTECLAGRRLDRLRVEQRIATIDHIVCRIKCKTIEHEAQSIDCRPDILEHRIGRGWASSMCCVSPAGGHCGTRTTNRDKVRHDKLQGAKPAHVLPRIYMPNASDV